MLTREQLVEFWHGLVNSGQRFLWVMRPDSVAGQDGGSQVPAELAKGIVEIFIKNKMLIFGLNNHFGYDIIVRCYNNNFFNSL